MRFITNLAIKIKSARVSQVREASLQTGGVREGEGREETWVVPDRGVALGEAGDDWKVEEASRESGQDR